MPLSIIGVVEDVNYENLENQVQPLDHGPDDREHGRIPDSQAGIRWMCKAPVNYLGQGMGQYYIEAYPFVSYFPR